MLYNGEQIGDGSAAGRRHRGRPARGHDAHRARASRTRWPSSRSQSAARCSTRARASTWRRSPAPRTSPTCSTSTARSARRSSWSPSARGVDVRDLMVVMLDRERHDDAVEEIREAGARIRFITDGDVAGALLAVTRAHRRRPALGHRRHAGGRASRRRRSSAWAASWSAACGRATTTSASRPARRRLRPRRGAHRRRPRLGRRLSSSPPPASPTATCSRASATTRRGATTESLVMRSRSGTVRRVDARHDRAKLREITGERYG